jgi:hypothetical protein
MAIYRVTCHTPDNADADRRIQGLGGVGPIGHGIAPPPRWWHDIDTIFGMIWDGDRLYVSVAGQNVDVVVRRHPHSRLYFLTTEGDDFPPNNLLKLPLCTE